MIKVDRQMLIDCMVENQDGCDIAVIKDERTDEISVIACERGSIETYCEMDQKELIESFHHYPADNGYDDENKYEAVDADNELDIIQFKNIEID